MALRKHSFTSKLIEPVIESALLILALLVDIRVGEMTIVLLNVILWVALVVNAATSLSHELPLLGLSLLWPLLELLAAPLRCRLAQTAIIR